MISGTRLLTFLEYSVAPQGGALYVPSSAHVTIGDFATFEGNTAGRVSMSI